MNTTSLALGLGSASLLVCALSIGCGSSDEDTSKGALSPAPSNTATAPAGSSNTTPPATSNTTPTPTSTSDSGTVPGVDAATGENCVAKGYAGNDKKIGAYCDEDNGCPFQVDPFLICTASQDPTGTHKFCTTPCQNDNQCGTGAFCMKESLGSGCVPTQCGGAPN